MKDFIHLHVHTEYSLLDGIARIKKLVKTVGDMDMPGVAITDHGNMYGVYKFYKEVMKYNEGVEENNNSQENKNNHKRKLKAIFGNEFYVSDNMNNKSGNSKRSHLVILAKNDIGYKNLVKLTSLSFTEGFYYKPRIDYDLLEEYSEGLICFSACLAGDIPQYLMHMQDDKAEELALKLKNIFGEDFFIELQNHKLPEQIEVLPKLDKLAKKLNIRTIATNDVHYIYKEDSETQDVLMCLQMGRELSDPTRMKFETEEFYLKSRDEMMAVLAPYEDAINNTMDVFNKIEQVHLKREDLIPLFDTPDNSNSNDFFRKIVFEGLVKRYGKISPEIEERVNMELSVIENMGFVDYFLIVWDFIKYAKSINVSVGPGRGSGAGSIVAYSTEITDIDPLMYNLLFERFLNPDRISMPDFDIDFGEGRDDVIEYVVEKYGAEKTCQIITYGRMASKAAIKDVARVLGVPASEANNLTKKIDVSKIKGETKLKLVFGLGNDEENEKYASPELIKIYKEDHIIKKVVDLAIKLEGVPRQVGQHAAGVIICKHRLDDHVPLALAKTPKGDKITTQYDMNESEELGLLKMDFLGLRTLTDIQKTTEIVKEIHGIEIDWASIKLDDKKVYDLIGNGDTDLIFQFESGGFKQFMRELKPDRFEDLIAGVSLYRPGPMDYIPDYIKNKKNPDKIKYDLKILEPILKETYGVIVYQEQVMKIFQDMAGYSLSQADIVRRAMSKKKHKVLEEHKEYFIYGKDSSDGTPTIDGALKRGATKKIAENIFKKMEKFSSYAFNKSHAACYAYIGYQTAYLKTYYPVELYTSSLNNRIEKSEDIAKYSISAKIKKINILKPSINKSDAFFTVENNSIRFGLGAMKNVGVALVNEIVKERNSNGEYKDIIDFIKRTYLLGINKRSIEAFILSGAFDEFNKARSQLINVYETIISRVSNEKKNEKNGQISIFEMYNTKIDSMNDIEYPRINEYPDDIKLRKEKDVIGAYIWESPLDKHLEKFEKYNISSRDLKEIEEDVAYDEDGNEIRLENDNVKNMDNMQVVIGGIITNIKKVYTRKDNKEMAILNIEDLYGNIDIMIFNKQWLVIKNKVEVDVMATFNGKISIREGERPIIIVSSIQFWDENTNNDSQKSIYNEDTNYYPKLYLKFNYENEKLKKEVLELLKESTGGHSKVTIVCEQSKRKVSYKNIKIDTRLLMQLEVYIKKEYIVIK